MTLREAIEHVKRFGASQFRHEGSAYAYRWDITIDDVVWRDTRRGDRTKWTRATFTTSEILSDRWEIWNLERVGTRFPGGE